MTKAFVHGNPETAALWSELVSELEGRGDDDIVLLSPPGFGAPVPAGWGATRIEYRDWLIAELESLDGPIDVLGHDWGAGHVYGLLAERPDLVRSWAADCAGLVHPDYVWHDAAQAWQTPGVGEDLIEAMLGGSLDDRTTTMVGLGLPQAVAAEIAAHQDEAMGRCILDLYRSATQPTMRTLGEELAQSPQPPGLVIIAPDDAYVGSVAMAEEVAASLSADTVTLEGHGHWWMFGGGATLAADALVAHWNRI